MTSKIIGKVNKEKKKKLSLKEELKDLKIKITYIDKNNFIININKIIKPYQRNRMSGFSNKLYDPLNSYKKYIQKEIVKAIKEFNNCNDNKIVFLNNHYITINSNIYLEPPSTFTKYKKLLALRGIIKPNQKPDNDNFEKTIFDIFNSIIWKDDSQVVFNQTSKNYYYENFTEIIVSFCEIENYEGIRITKDIKEKMTDRELKYLYN